MNQNMTLPNELRSVIATNADEFKRLFPSKGEWERVCSGDAYLHLIVKELDELMLETPGEWSKEVDAAKASITSYIRNAYDVSVDVACAALRRVYVCTPAEYDLLIRREYGNQQTEPWVPLVGVYDSVKEEDLPWFNFCLEQWNRFHENATTEVVIDDVTRKDYIIAYTEAIQKRWDSMSEVERLGWG